MLSQIKMDCQLVVYISILQQECATLSEFLSMCFPANNQIGPFFRFQSVTDKKESPASSAVVGSVGSKLGVVTIDVDGSTWYRRREPCFGNSNDVRA